MELNKEQLINHLGQMTVMEMANLVHELEDRWGVSATPQMAQTTKGLNPDPIVEQTEFDVRIMSYGEKKIAVIKALRQEIPGLGLKEAKFMAESEGGLLKEGVSREEAEVLKSVLTEAGATITIS